MAVNLGTVQTGMDVLDPSGNKIGTVADILNVAARSATGSNTGAAGLSLGTAGDLETTTVPADNSSQTTYLKVDQGGILGIGAKELYIPFSAVQNVVPGDNLTVNCTKDTCDSMYGNKPDFLP